MAKTTKRIETTDEDGYLKLESMPDGDVLVTIGDLGRTVTEANLLDVVLQYASDRGLRRLRKPREKATTRKRAKPSNGAVVVPEPPVVL